MLRSSVLSLMCLALAFAPAEAATKKITIGTPVAAITKQISSIKEGDPALIEIVTVVPWPASLTLASVQTPNGSIKAVSPTTTATSDDGTKRKQRHQFQIKSKTSPSGAYTLTFTSKVDPSSKGSDKFALADGGPKTVKISLAFESWSTTTVNAK